MNYSDEGDRLLREAGAAHLTEPAFAAQWRNVATTEHIEAVAAEVVADEPERHHLDCGLTRRQREVLRSARLLRRRAHSENRSLVTVIAEEYSISRQAALTLLNRIRDRIEARRRTEEPPAWVLRTWQAEIRHKQRMIYRRPQRGWISAYCWSRKRWKDKR